MQYRRAKTPGGTYFFTVVTFRRRKFLCEPDIVELLRTAFRTVKSARPFTINAFVLPPTTMITRCAGMPSKTISPAIVRMPSNYQYHRPNDVNGRKPSGSRAIGNTKSGNGRDFEKHWDYIHWSMVKHGLVTHPGAGPIRAFTASFALGFIRQIGRRFQGLMIWGITQADRSLQNHF
ncbi:MAG TPA: transposase [Methylobacter sp.]|jgi:putative transposase